MAFSAAAVAAAAAALVVSGCARHRVVTPPPPSPTATPFAVSPLDGMAVPPRSIRHRIDAVVVDNYPDARPQSGLRDADVVATLEKEVVKKFSDSFKELLEGVRAKRETVAA